MGIAFKGQKKYTQSGGQDNYIESYRQFVRNFASENNLLLIDTDLALRDACKKWGPEKIIISDGVHLTKEANKIIADLVFEKISAFLNQR